MAKESLSKILAGMVAGVFGFFFYKNRKKESTSSWDQSKPVTDQSILDTMEVVYNDVVDRIRDKYPNQRIASPVFSRRVYLHPGPLPKPYQNRWGVGFPEHADGGNNGGNVVLLESKAASMYLWEHEFAHVITGITDHPVWLFGRGLSLNV